MIRAGTAFLTAAFMSVFGPAAAAAAADTDAWDAVLEKHQRDGGLDYAALAADRAELDRYLSSLEGARPGDWSENRQLAFWTNAYNAVTAHHVLERYPGLESVKDVSGFFDRLTFPVAGEEHTLDEIEDRARELSALSHFGVVCASTSCPDLRGEAYRGERVIEQLEEQTRAFLADSGKGMRYDRDGNTLYLSSIFKWYAGDFTGGSTIVAYFLRSGLVDWVQQYLPEALAQEIERRDPSVSYLDYDWSLNDR